MANDARVNLVGNLVGEPKTSQWNNSTILSFTVGVKTTKKQENSQYYDSDFYNVSVWGKQGETLLNTLQKGTMVWVEGDMLMRSYKNRNGETVTQPSVNASSVKVLAKGKNWNGQSNKSRNRSNTATDQTTNLEEPPF
jgi:single-strand DNA-binding protein